MTEEDQLDQEMTRAFDEIAAHNADLASLGVGARPRRARAPRRSPRPGMSGLVTVLVMCALVGVTGLWRQIPGVEAVVAVAAGQEGPSEEVAGSTTGPHAFLAENLDGSPIGYDPCRDVHWVVNPEGSPDGGTDLVREAVDEVARATGLTFVEDGTTADPVAFGGLSARPWAADDPVLIGWTDPERVPDLAGAVVGVGGSKVQGSVAGSSHLVAGVVALDAAQMAPLVADPAVRDEARAVVMHELGHVVGLAHVEDPEQIMFEANLGQTSWGAGDLEGLAAVGSTTCGP